MTEFFKIISLIGLSSIKFAMAFPYALALSLNFTELFIYTSIGGVLGILAFLNFSNWIICSYNKFFPPKKKNTFTKRNRIIVKIWKNYGLIGISILTPVLLSIPVGCFIVIRYKEPKQRAFIYLSAAVLFWSCILSALIKLFDYTVF